MRREDIPEKKGEKKMKEVFEIHAEKDGDKIEIKGKGICTVDLLYAVAASILENAEKGVKIHEN